MRDLSETLQAAIRSTHRVPALALTVEDRVQHFPLLHALDNTDDVVQDACIAADKSIIRVWVDNPPSGSIRCTYRYQRITDPTQLSQWQSSTIFGSGTDLDREGACAVSLNPGNILRAFGFRTLTNNTSQLLVWTSTNNGQTWSTSPTVVATFSPSANIKGISSAGNNDVFFLLETTAGIVVAFCLWNGSAWSAPQQWSNVPALATFANGSGLAVAWLGDRYHLVISTKVSLLNYSYWPGSGQWFIHTEILDSSYTGTIHLFPRIIFDPGSQRYLLAHIQNDNGVRSGLVSQTVRVRSATDPRYWSNGASFRDGLPGRGVSLVSRPDDGVYLITAQRVYRSPHFRYEDENQFAVLTNALLSYERVEQLNQPARIEITLDNSNGQWNDLIGSQTRYRPINFNASLCLYEGYRTSSGDEIVRTGTYRITQIALERAPNRHLLKLVALDLSHQLDHVNLHQDTIPGFGARYIITRICSRAGIPDPDIPLSGGDLDSPILSFLLPTGQPMRAALDEICMIYQLSYFLDPDERLHFRFLPADEAPVWSFQPELETVTFTSNADRANHVIVSGRAAFSSSATVNGEAYDEANVHHTGIERLAYRADPKINGSDRCTAAALSLLNEQRTLAMQRVLTVPYHPGLEPGDVISVSDPRSASTGNVRIVRLDSRYDRASATYTHRLHCSGT